MVLRIQRVDFFSVELKNVLLWIFLKSYELNQLQTIMLHVKRSVINVFNQCFQSLRTQIYICFLPFCRMCMSTLFITLLCKN